MPQLGGVLLCRGSCGDRYPYKKHHASFSVCPAFTPRTQQLDVREVDDAWIIFIDVPGMLRPPLLFFQQCNRVLYGYWMRGRDIETSVLVPKTLHIWNIETRKAPRADF